MLHATEDEGKVLKAIEDMLLVPSKRFSASSSEGHYKNKILRRHFRVMRQARYCQWVISLLNSADREHLSRSIHEYTDEKGNLYIRLDKQRMLTSGFHSQKQTP